jgi:hypothetical protein
VDNIKMDLAKIAWGGVAWSGSGQEQVLGCCESGNEPLGYIKCCAILEWLHNLWPLK